jgi:hypothetical protein
MQQSPPWEANSHSAGQEILRLLWNPTVHNHVRKNPTMVPIPSQMNPIHILTSYLIMMKLKTENAQ